MKKRYFVGIDGGGTKSRLQLENEQGQLLAKCASGPASIKWSVETTWHSINSALEESCQSAGVDLEDPNNEFYAGIGLAGCEVSIAQEKFLNTPNRFTKIILNSDGYTACLGAHDRGNGAIITVGTGVVGFIMQGNQSNRVGGWGFPHGDQGGGAWLGLEAAKLTFQWIDRRIAPTPLLKAIFHHFDNNAHIFSDWANQADAKQFASLAPLVINHIAEEDPWALLLIKNAAKEIDSIYEGLLHYQEEKNPVKVCLFGGIAPFVKPWISQKLQDVLVERKFDATKGAILMIRDAVLEA